MEKAHYCYDCRFYRAYYVMGLNCFDKLKYGRCSKHDNLLCENHGSCQLWQRNFQLRELRKAVALKKLIQLSEDISALKLILDEEYGHTQE